MSARERILLGFMVWVGWAWRLTGLTSQSLWRDEVDTLRFSLAPWPQVLARFTRPGENGPLYYLLMRPWLQGAGHSEFALRFPSVWWGTLALPLIFLWGHKLLGYRGGLLAMALLAVNPYHGWYSQEARMYALLVALMLLIFWSFQQAMEGRGKRWWGIWWLLTSLSFYIHVLAALALPVQALWVLVMPAWRRRGWQALLAFLALGLPYVPLIGWQWTLLTDVHFRTGHPFVPLPRMLTILWMVQIQGIPGSSPWWLAAPFFLTASAFFLPPFRPRLLARLSGGWLLPPLLLYLITLFTPLFTDRYLIWTLPALILVLSLGGLQVARQQPLIATLALMILVGFQITQGVRQITTPIKPDLRAAAAYVAPRRQEGDLTLFLMPYIHHTYRYYDPGPYPWAEAPYANREPDASLVPQRLAQITQGYRGVWLIESEAAFYDRQGLIPAWFDAHARLVEEAAWNQVRVRYYRFPGWQGAGDR